MNGREADWVAGAIADPDAVRAILLAEAAARRAISYSDLLNILGHRFTRPKMRALCKTLDVIDVAARAKGEPELAVLVVRESDGLPGQGWWVGVADRLGYAGPWAGPQARAFVADVQGRAFERCGGAATSSPRAAGSSAAPLTTRRARSPTRSRPPRTPLPDR